MPNSNQPIRTVRLPTFYSHGRSWEDYLFMFLAMAVPAWLMSFPMILHFDPKLGAKANTDVFMGPLITIAAWGCGLGFTHAILNSNDSKLFGLLPLTPGQFHWRNTWRVLPLIICVYLLSLIAVSIGMSISRPDMHLTVGQLFHLMFMQWLSLVLCFLVPLFERSTGERWTGFFFFPRAVLRFCVRHIRKILPVSGAALVVGTAAWLAGFRFPTLAESAAGLWRRCEPAGEIIHFFAFPFSGTVFLHDLAGTDGAAFIWLEAPLLLFSGYLVWRVLRALNPPVEKWQSQIYDNWTTHREQIEAYQNWESWVIRLVQEMQLPMNIQADKSAAPASAYEEADASAIVEMGWVLEYDETFAPEVQAVRHDTFWAGRKQPSTTRKLVIRGAVAIGLFWLGGRLAETPLIRMLDLDLFWMTACLIGFWFFSLVHADGYMSQLSRTAARYCLGPLRRPQLERALGWKEQIPHWLAVDILCATCLTVALTVPWAQLPCIAAVLVLLRAGMYLTERSQCNIQTEQDSRNISPAMCACILGPMWQCVYAALFHPGMMHSNRFITAPLSIRIHETFFQVVYSWRTMAALLPVWSLVLVAAWASIKRHERKWGVQPACIPHLAPHRIQRNRRSSRR